MPKSRQDIFSCLDEIPDVVLTDRADLDAHLRKQEPFIVRRIASDWPLVQAGLISFDATRQYLLDARIDRNFPVTIGQENCHGLIFYNDDMSMNISMREAKLPDIFERIEAANGITPQPLIYLSSIDMKKYFKYLHIDNTIDLNGRECMESIWIGTRSQIAAHNDFPDNLACVAVGRRRFTLFPPEQFHNLYIGPLDNTPAGRPISMVDFHNPDLIKFPKFELALKSAQSVVLGAGDAIYIPSSWWHHVEALDTFNVLVNYWWQETPHYWGQPDHALFHAMMSVRDLPERNKKYWKAMFDYYVFEQGGTHFEHIPDLDKTIQGFMSPENAMKLRSYLLKALNS